MLTLEALQHKISSGEDLLSVVKTMKAMAAVSIRQYEKAVESAEAYFDTVELGFRALFRRGRNIGDLIAGYQKTETTIVLAVGSDQGMCGQFNERIFGLMENGLNELENENQNLRVLAIGAKLSGLISSSDTELKQTFRAPASIRTVSSTVEEILFYLSQVGSEVGIFSLHLYYNAKSSGSSYEPLHIMLLPFGLNYAENLREKGWQSDQIPSFRISSRQLLSSLTRQYMFAGLYRALAESLASENASRLAAMQAAEKNIEERLKQYTTEYHHQRQESITSELLDMVAGFEALTGDDEDEEEDSDEDSVSGM
ncbi:MAG: F0F1 ATP synthase subunit gamma [candidate division Zixibacteria bacterium]|nr:F0F1 ATP synthase subunit gamma [candidate division Zixibacteria bacterium]